MTIVISIEAVGIILVIAMLITPGCVAYLLTDRFDRMLMIAVASAVFSEHVRGVCEFLHRWSDRVRASC